MGEARRALEHEGRIERVDVWGRQGWGNAAHAFCTPAGVVRPGLMAAA